MVDGDFYLFALMFITLGNEMLGIYHHPGPLTYCESFQNSQEVSSMLLYGANSSARFVRGVVPFETGVHPGCVILLEPPGVDGQAFPYAKELPEHRDWPGMPEARERSYLLIPPLGPDVHAGVTVLNVTRNARGEVSIRANVQDGRIVTMAADLRPVGVYLTLNSTADDLYKNSRGSFLPYLLIQNGRKEYVQVPVTVD